MQQCHRFGGGGGLVQQRRVRHVHSRQVRDHRLEVDQRLQPALGDLGLIGRVGGVPAGILEDHPQDHTGRDGVVVAQADIRAEQRLRSATWASRAEKLNARSRGRDLSGFSSRMRARHHLVDQLVE